MATRLVVLEVADTRSEDLLRMAIKQWNEDNEGDPRSTIVHRPVYSCPFGDQAALDR